MLLRCTLLSLALFALVLAQGQGPPPGGNNGRGPPPKGTKGRGPPPKINPCMKVDDETLKKWKDKAADALGQDRPSSAEDASVGSEEIDTGDDGSSSPSGEVKRRKRQADIDADADNQVDVDNEVDLDTEVDSVEDSAGSESSESESNSASAENKRGKNGPKGPQTRARRQALQNQMNKGMEKVKQTMQELNLQMPDRLKKLVRGEKVSVNDIKTTLREAAKPIDVTQIQNFKVNDIDNLVADFGPDTQLCQEFKGKLKARFQKMKERKGLDAEEKEKVKEAFKMGLHKLKPADPNDETEKINYQMAVEAVKKTLRNIADGTTA